MQIFDNPNVPKVTPKQLDALGGIFLGEFETAKADKRAVEDRMLTDLRQFRGKYEPEEIAAMEGRSEVFNRKTRVKVRTTTARMMDLLFPAKKQNNWTVEPTPNPSVSPQTRAKAKALLRIALGKEPQKGDIDEAVRQIVGKSCDAMQTTIEDQLVEANYKAVARKVIRSGNLFGTGILKAPLVQISEKTSFAFNDQNNRWEPHTTRRPTPFVDYVPVWRWYPDMSSTCLEDCLYTYEHHSFGRHQMMGLANRKSFDRAAIIEHIRTNPMGASEMMEYEEDLKELGERQEQRFIDTNRYDLIERWGWITAEQLQGCGIEIPDEQMHEAFFGNVFILPTGQVVRASLKPPVPGMLYPYHLYYFDWDETSIWGEGLAAIMRDDQSMLNAATRMVLDNGAAASGPNIEINSRLVPTTDRPKWWRPWKMWWRTGDDPTTPAIRVHEVASRVQELSAIAGIFDNNCDENSGIPRYLSGENATQGAAGTARGLSMLMGNTAILLNDQITAYDDGITIPFIGGMYKWNMYFNPDPAIKGEFDVHATGASSTVAKEILSQELTAFAQSVNNPMDAPFIKRQQMLSQRAEAAGLSDIVKTEEEVNQEQNTEAGKAQQQLMQAQQQLQMAQLEAQANKTMAEAQKALADVERIKAQTLNLKVEAAYAAMEAAGVAVTNAHIAPAGDEILRSAGWQDATPQTQTPVAPPQAQPNIQPPQSPHHGQRAGIETPGI